MKNRIKLPKYIIAELDKASVYATKSSNCIENFEQWVRNKVDEDFDFDVLRASSSNCEYDEIIYQTEALTEIEYGGYVDIDKIENAINYFANKNIKDVPVSNKTDG